MKRWFVLFIAFTFIFSVNTPTQGSEANITIPNKIKVGLYYGSSSRNSYELSSDVGFVVGRIQNKNPFTVVSFSDKLLEVCSASSSNFTPEKSGISDRETAAEYGAKLINRGTKCYLFFDNSWSVWVDNNSNNSNAASDLIMIKGDSKYPAVILPVSAESPVFFAGSDLKTPISIEGRRYRGMLEMTTSGNLIQVVNELGLDEYLYGVIPCEMPSNWDIEALKAQTVAARTYAVANLGKWQNYGFDVSAGSSDQVYGGFSEETAKTNQAVDQTSGQILLYDGKPITAFYHADSGGRTEACKDVFGIDLPYLQPVDDIVPSQSPYETWQISLDELSKRYNTYASSSIGDIKEIIIAETTLAGRAKKLLLKGTKGETLLSSDDIRNLLQLKSNYLDIAQDQTAVPAANLALAVLSGDGSKKNIRLSGINILSQQGINHTKGDCAVISAEGIAKKITSSYNTPNTSDDIYVISGHGCGHGVGMSQWGAKAMAENGYSYTEILYHYYTGVEITP
ncbi:SpoIID/LytB domain-containing protein [Tepidanaerobacter sp. EBM-49]|uniref:SpoIID/LytB domain-containing protein n=1 Tax=Tepidanaerobacter sp. EBM-49 TaxID=1918504 RepID=UPI000AF68BF0|nr:SpoIID/LytB domain-containing protein [Tepidanaerobacter sp. EBM-49]